MLMQCNITGQVVEQARGGMLGGRFCHRKPSAARSPAPCFWLTLTVRSSVAPSKTEKGASQAYAGEPGEVTNRRYWPSAKLVNVQFAVADALSFFSALLAN